MTAHEYVTERSAIAEYDGGLSREQADDQAAAGLRGVPEFTHIEKISGLAKYLCDMPTNAKRRDFLARFAKRHGDEIAKQLRQATWEAMQGRGND